MGKTSVPPMQVEQAGLSFPSETTPPVSPRRDTSRTHVATPLVVTAAVLVVALLGQSRAARWGVRNSYDCRFDYGDSDRNGYHYRYRGARCAGVDHQPVWDASRGAERSERDVRIR